MVLPASVTQICDFYLEALGQPAFNVVERDLVLEVFKQLLYALLGLHRFLLLVSLLLLLFLLALLLFVCLKCGQLFLSVLL